MKNKDDINHQLISILSKIFDRHKKELLKIISIRENIPYESLERLVDSEIGRSL